jgi:hypothetical protein
MKELAGTLADIALLLRRYIVLTPSQAVACALWVAHTHALEAADTTPYIAITSPEKESGKTRTLEVLELLAARPWFTSRVTAAVLPRRIDKEQSTLLLDESDAAFGGDKEYAETLRGVLNSGYRRGGGYSVCVGQGANISYVTLSTFGAKAIAGLNKLPDTVASRSIPIRLRRRTRGELVEKFYRREAETVAEPIRLSIESLASFHVENLREARPEIPAQLSDRAADVWEPLLAIADLAGDIWPAHAREAAVELSTGALIEDDSLGVLLLADVKAVYEAAAVDRLSSASLVSALNDLAESPWGEWNKGKGLTQNRLAGLLRRFDVRSRTVRLHDETTPKGYRRDQFSDAWGRYLAPVPPSGSATPPQPASLSEKQADSKRHTAPLVAVAKTGANPHGQSDVAAVALQKQGEAGNGHLSHEEREAARLLIDQATRDKIAREDAELREKGRALFADDPGAIRP